MTKSPVNSLFYLKNIPKWSCLSCHNDVWNVSDELLDGLELEICVRLQITLSFPRSLTLFICCPANAAGWTEFISALSVYFTAHVCEPLAPENRTSP